ncbi:hypothetical protein evm_012778 [Chilo suppressalis]|nr:hypothetical protein evm_012778 [Chilo suppressalis]
MGFNGLFAAVELRARELADHLSAPLPPAWRKVDHVSEAAHLSATLQSSVLRSVLEDMFLVRRVQAAGEVFALAGAAARAFSGTAPGSTAHPDPASLTKPVRRWTAEYVSRCVLGVGPRALASCICLLLRRAPLDLAAEVEQKEIGASWTVPLESLYEKARARWAGGISSVRLERAGVLAARLQAARAQTARAAHALRNHARATTAAHHARLQARAHAHTHPQVVAGSADPGPPLSRRGRELSAWTDKLSAAVGRTQALVTAAHQSSRHTKLLFLTKLVIKTKLGIRTNYYQVSQSKLDIEALLDAINDAANESTPTKDPVQILLCSSHIDDLRGRVACTLAQKYALQVTPVEESLMEMLHPEGNIDKHWVESVGALVREVRSGRVAAADAARAGAGAGAGAVRAAGRRVDRARANRRALLLPAAHPLLQLQPLHKGNNPAAIYLAKEQQADNLAGLIASLAGDTHDEGEGEGEATAEVTSPVTLDSHGVRAALHAAIQLGDMLPALDDMLLELSSSWAADASLRRAARALQPTRHRTGQTCMEAEQSPFWLSPNSDKFIVC